MLKQFCTLYFTTLLVMAIMDVVWLKGVMQHLFKAQLGDLVEFRLTPAVLFYLLYPIGIILFVSHGATHWQQVLPYGAALGLLCYGTYDLTNLATLRPWTLKLALIDIAWGGIVTGLSATAGWLATRAILN